MNHSNETELTVEDVLRSFREDNFVVIGLYVPVFVVALLANVLVIWVVIKDQYMRSVTNYFLVNLSVADLLVALVCMPNAAYAAYTSTYSFGEYTCKISAYFQCVSVASSIFTITAMSIDRYLAITKPFGFFNRCFNKRNTVIVILVLWLLSFVLFLPILLVTGTWKMDDIHLFNKSLDIPAYFCREDWTTYFGSSGSEMRQALGITWFIFMFVVPGMIMLFAYSMMSRTLCSGVPPFDSNDGLSCMQQRNRLMRSRKRVACILLLLAFVFAGCWMPYHLVSLLDDLNNGPYKTLKMNLVLLGHANSALNPIIYCALSRKFRRSIKDLICIDIHFTRRRQNIQWGDSSGSGTQLHYLHRIKSVPTVHNQLHFTLGRLQSSQKTTKTCVV
ncbi:orexin receptor type 2 isoform X2 [Tribolium castaneum]|uniref:Tachykinin-like peptides receptor 99D n=1 Tax=Tribolium castaneum TaxID=7070 RepID=D6WTB3_TRICA|nr:PREDICTED: orexin receptor type 2 isoform X2 [Tribolium castaneum]EFA07466.2 Tachykinin-like peptides receptor 99D [Tribolium castaneum]|eukprot:XP_972230.2 PREDICTED: orexin receptor type 2 isoform X2 [Tribolium castaneum]